MTNTERIDFIKDLNDLIKKHQVFFDAGLNPLRLYPIGSFAPVGELTFDSGKEMYTMYDATTGILTI